MSTTPVNNQGARTLPHNLDAERGVLGSMLLSAEAQLEVMSILTSEDFYRPSHQVIFAAMAELLARGQKYDHISLADKLTSDNQLSAVGGADYLADLSLSVPTTSHYKRYADIVKKLSTYRQLVFAGTDISALAFESPDDVETAVARAENRLFDVTEQQVSSDFKPLGGQVLESAYHLLEEYAESKNGIVGVPTGFSELDRLTRGFRGGQLIVLGARPGVGKTALALNMARGAARGGKATVGIFSLEMTAEDLALRMLTSEAGIGSQQIRSGNIRPEWWDRFMDASSFLSELPISIDDTPDLNINRLRVKARRRFRSTENKKLLIVDYLQLMSSDGRYRERHLEVAQISRGLKILAKDLDVPILALSQLSRPLKTERAKRPQLSDLRDSGAIEQDADIVMFLHRDMDPMPAEDDDESRLPSNLANLIVAKHRNGPTRDILLEFNKEIARFFTPQHQ